MIEAFKLLGQIAIEGGAKAKKELSGIGEKAKKLGGDIKKVGKNAQNFGKSMSKYITAPLVGVGAGLLAVAKKTGDYSDRILDLNAITGMSTDAIQEWQHVSKYAGVGAETMTNASKQLTKTMTRLQNGTGLSSDALEDLGVNLEDLQKASPDEQMNILTNALRGIEDPSERARIGTDLFKGSFEDLAPVLAMSEEQIAEAKKEAHELGSVMGGDALNESNNFRIELELLTTKLMNMGRDLATEVIPILRDIFVPIIETAMEKVKALSQWFKGLSDGQQEMLVKTLLIVASLGPLIALFGTVMIFVGQAITQFGVIIGIFKKVRTAIMGMNLAFMLGPWGWVILGIVAVIGIGILLYKNWDKIRAFLIKAWEMIKRKWNEFYSNFTNKLNDLKTKATTKMNEIKTAITTRINEAVSTAKTKFNNMAKFITDPIKRAKDKISGYIENIKSFFNRMKLKFPKISLPSLPRFKIHNWSLNPANWIKNPPYLGVSWHAQGGYVDGATLIGAGEKGGEGIVPLEGQHMLPMAKAIGDYLGDTFGSNGASKQTIEIPIYLNAREIARAIAPNIDTELQRQKTFRKRGV